MELIVRIVSTVLVFGGVTLMLMALKCRSEKHPDFGSLQSYHPRNWVLVWRMQEYFTPAGHRMNLIGTVSVVLGVAMHAVLFLI